MKEMDIHLEFKILYVFARQVIGLLGIRSPLIEVLDNTVSRLSELCLEQKTVFDIRLSKREQDALVCAAQGLSVKETAAELLIAQKTVRSYRESILHKLDCKNMVQAVYVGMSKSF